MTKMDNSVLGRERALFNAFFEFKNGRGDRRNFVFARWTLLGRVIRSFKPDNTYCHLDGFDFDQFSHTSNAFTGVGRVWMLPEPGTPGTIATMMSVEFDRSNQRINRAMIWIGPNVPRRRKAPRVECVEPWALIGEKYDPGQDWRLAFRKDGGGWQLDPNFDLSELLMPVFEKRLSALTPRADMTTSPDYGSSNGRIHSLFWLSVCAE